MTVILQRLKELRKQINISQKQLADVVQVSQQSINKYENHDVQPDLDTLMRLAAYFNVSVDYLIGFSDYPHSFVEQAGQALSNEELQFLSLFHKLSAEEKDSILTIMQQYYRLKTK